MIRGGIDGLDHHGAEAANLTRGEEAAAAAPGGAAVPGGELALLAQLASDVSSHGMDV